MKILRRLSVELRALVHEMLDHVEKPELGLHQAILELEQHLKAIRNDLSESMRHENELASQHILLARRVEQCRALAETNACQGQLAEARRALGRAERAESRVAECLAQQRKIIAETRASALRLAENLDLARHQQRLWLLSQRQTNARPGVGDGPWARGRKSLIDDLDRLGDKVESAARRNQALLQLEDELDPLTLEPISEEPTLRKQRGERKPDDRVTRGEP